MGDYARRESKTPLRSLLFCFASFAVVVAVSFRMALRVFHWLLGWLGATDENRGHGE